MSQKINIKAIDVNELLKRVSLLEKHNVKLQKMIYKMMDHSTKMNRLLEDAETMVCDTDNLIQHEVVEFIDERWD